MKYRAILLAALLLFARPTAGEAAESCREFFARLGQSGKSFARQYAAELKSSYGARFFVRAHVPAEEENERRLLLLWAQLPPGEVPWTERAYRRALRLSPANPDSPRYRFDPLGGIDQLMRGLDRTIQFPIRITTGYLHGRGWLDREYRFTLPTLAIVSGLGIERLKATSAEYRDEAEADKLLRYDYRFRAVQKAQEKLQKELRAAREAGATEPELAELEANGQLILRGAIDKLAEALINYHALAAEEQALIKAAPTESERLRLEEEWTQTLSKHPLFSDLTRRAFSARPDGRCLLGPRFLRATAASQPSASPALR